MNRPVSKTLLIVLVIIVLAVIGFFVYNHHSNKGVPTPVSETNPVPTQSAAWPSAKVKDATVNDKSSYYTITATYPVVNDPVISGYFKKYVDDSIAGFKEDTSWANGDTTDAVAQDLSLDIAYTEEKNAHADNYIFTTNSYEGGAHGLQSTKTFTFSATGQQVALSTLFTNGIAGLKTIAPYVKSQLSKALPNTDQQFIDDGTMPQEGNYQVFTVQDDGITFLFDAYQVAPYSDGRQTVHVPLSVFKTIADPALFK